MAPTALSRADSVRQQYPIFVAAQWDFVIPDGGRGYERHDGSAGVFSPRPYIQEISVGDGREEAPGSTPEGIARPAAWTRKKRQVGKFTNLPYEKRFSIEAAGCFVAYNLLNLNEAAESPPTRPPKQRRRCHFDLYPAA